MIVDAFTRQAIEQDTVRVDLLRKDSSLVVTAKSYIYIDQGNGVHRTCVDFDIPEEPSGDMILRLACDGYQTTYKNIRVVWKKSPVELSEWDIPLRRISATKERKLGEATVTATKIKFYTKGDTLVYNADAFQLQEGSMLDALIAQLPGAELKSDGRILVNGKQVESLLLNGRDFFKGDNTVLLDNLPAYMVQKVKVYNKEGDMSRLLGEKVDDGQFVMDVALKRQYSIGWLSNAEAGYGTRDRYLGRLFAMRFTPQSHVSAFCNFNNVNDRRKPDGNGGWGDFDPSCGLTTTRRGGIDYNVYDKRDRFEFSGDAEVNYTDNDDIWGGTSTEFYSGGDVYHATSSAKRTKNLTVNTSHTFKVNPKRGISFSLSPTFDYTKKDYTNNYLNGSFSVQPLNDYTEVPDSLFSPAWTSTVKNLINRHSEQLMGNSRNTHGGLDFWTFFKLPYTNNGFSFDGGIHYTHHEEEQFNNYSNYCYDAGGTLQQDLRNRYHTRPQNNLKASVRGIFFWHWNKEIMLNPKYTFTYKHGDGDRMHYRLDFLEESDGQAQGWLPSHAENLLKALDTDNSYRYDLKVLQHTLTFDWQWQHDAYNDNGKRISSWNIRIMPYFILENNRFEYLGNTNQYILKDYFLPQANLRIKRNTKDYLHEWTLQATIRTSSPSMSNLVDKTFTNDPLNITHGNPNLKARTDYNLSLNYKSDKWMQRKERSLYANAGWKMTHNAVCFSYIYDKTTGVKTSTPTNMNGNWSTWLGGGFSTPIDKKRRFSLSSSTSLNYYITVDFSGTQEDVEALRSTTKTTSAGENLRLTYRYKKTTLGASGDVRYYHSTSDRTGFSDIDTWAIHYGLNAVIDLPWHLQFSTDLTMFTRRGYESSVMNRDDLVWNARLSKSLWKNRLTVMVDAWDILGNLSNINAGLNNQNRWEYFTNVIPRYALLRVVYRFNKQPKKIN